MAAALQVSDVHKSFVRGDQRIDVLRGVTFALEVGQSLALTGPSGSGKSTLLHLLGTLDAPSSGKISLDGQNPFALNAAELARFRNRHIGFVFQNHHLLPQYSVLENVLVPTLAFPVQGDDSRARALDVLQAIGLAHRVDHRPAELSGGECQRVAVARALINRPRLLLCDEPTGSLDQTTAAAVADLLFQLHQNENTVLVTATHDLQLARRFAHHLALREGACVAP
tara:strand:- start:182 stop:859 length:678 start_codon:yes stop_codon:yes gene_type:complete